MARNRNEDGDGQEGSRNQEAGSNREPGQSNRQNVIYFPRGCEEIVVQQIYSQPPSPQC